MLASALAQDLEEDLSSVEAFVGDLVGADEVEGMAGKTKDFGPSSVTAEAIAKMLDDGFSRLAALCFCQQVRPFLTLRKVMQSCSRITLLVASASLASIFYAKFLRRFSSRFIT
jgi:hypothetical protein